jgi:hypothetical protein
MFVTCATRLGSRAAGLTREMLLPSACFFSEQFLICNSVAVIVGVGVFAGIFLQQLVSHF